MEKQDVVALIKKIEALKPSIRFFGSRTDCETFWQWLSRQARTPRESLRRAIRKHNPVDALSSLMAMYENIKKNGSLVKYKNPKPVRQLPCLICGMLIFEKVRDAQRHCESFHDFVLNTPDAKKWLERCEKHQRIKEGRRESRKMVALYCPAGPRRPFGSPSAGSPGLGKRKGRR